MTTHLFVDTNIWLDFYRSNNEAGLSLLKHLQSISPQIIVTDQVEMEFRKNRQGEILKFIANLTLPQGISFPAFLARTPEATELRNKLKEANRLIKQMKSRLPDILSDPEANDSVYQICHKVFSKNDDLRFRQSSEVGDRIRGEALNRYQLGFPPRKSDDTSMGDAINWEWMIHCAKTNKSNVVIVSRDGDYGCDSGEKVFLNDQLRSEFSDRASKEQRVLLYRKLTKALKEHFSVKVSKKEEEEENRLIQSSEAVGPVGRRLWATRLEQFDAYYNTASSPLALQTWAAIRENALHSAKKQAAIVASADTLRKEGQDES